MCVLIKQMCIYEKYLIYKDVDLYLQEVSFFERCHFKNISAKFTVIEF